MQILSSPPSKAKYKKWASGVVVSGALNTGATAERTIAVTVPFKVRAVLLYGAINTINSQPSENFSDAFVGIAQSQLFRLTDNVFMGGGNNLVNNGMGQTGIAQVVVAAHGSATFNVRMLTQSGATNVYMFTKWVAFGE